MELFLSLLLGMIVLVWIFRLLLPWILPWILKRLMKRFAGGATFFTHAGPGMHSEDPEPQQAQEPEKIVGDDVGEYVDFEEVDKKQ